MDNPHGSREQDTSANKVSPDPTSVGSVDVSGDDNKKLGKESEQASATNTEPAKKSLWERWQGHTLPERLMAYFTFVIAISSAIQVWVLISSSGQTDKLITAANTQAGAAMSISSSAGEFTKSSNAMKDKLGEAVADFKQAADQSAAASQTAANTAERNIKNAQDSFRSEQRAWLGLQEFRLSTYEPGKIVIAMNVVNSGKSPAREVYFGDQIFTRNQSLNGLEPNMLIHDWVLGPAIPPQGKFGLSIVIPKDTVAQFQNTVTPRKYLYVVGDFIYDLSDGTKAVTHYCFELSADSDPKTVTLCIPHNDMK
jgi:hypothetical protein